MSLIYLGPLHNAEILSSGVRVPASLAHAMEAAPAVLAAANAEAESIRREAEKRGYQDGMERGQAAMADLISDAHMRAGYYATQMLPLLVDCAMHAVRKVLEDTDQSVLIEQVTERVRERLADEDGLVLIVAPARMEAAMAAAERLMQKYGSTLPVRVIANAAFGANDWVVESSLGRAEVKRDAQLTQLRALIQNAFANLERMEEEDNGDDDDDDDDDDGEGDDE